MKLKSIVTLLIAGGLVSPLAYATNGMNLEGYGPVAAAMGGASMAYDNGTAAVMNNPATLGLMAEGSQVDVAVGLLAPSITSKVPGASVDSSATAFYMPAMGYAHKSGKLTYGVGVFSQGGMGTEYSGSSFMAAGSGQTVRSEVGVGRFIVPLVYQVNDKLNIGGSVDFVWATMDLQMALSGAQFADMMPGGTQTYGTAGGSLVTAFGGAVAGGMFNPANPVNWAYFNFSDSGKFSGLAKANGFAEKIGFTYKLNPELTIGGTYHSKTAMGDLTAAAMSVTMNANVDNAILGATWDGQPGGGAHGTPAGTYTAVSVPVTGSITVKNFQWPDTYGLGMAYQASDQLLLVADYKRIGWKAVMKSFNMTFTAGTQTGLATGFSGKVLDATLYQNWEDQNVIELGGAYKTSDALTLRAGVNVANNPVPDKYMNPLFPAIAKSHVTMGAGYAISKSSTLNFDYAYMNKNTVTNGSGVTVDFGGYSAQFLYSHKY